ncbi:peptidase S41 [Polaribacter reichenbachii]|uniref:Peptidase S41 n=1 Tax=Polaribacter reichenbachii TaxID=996801 RepID=A0A1B8U1R2_9FLAO|nr:S41 family peptidase [Polaribacter reichenbachii]APZ48169.1 peptidase S41 [Polaribacter reichenbachii]AUC20438.1 peptidase S41 [Polaribacter reichenbachii]OBY65808.1 peptidase S41 [Polaribacter reichenbachii]
MKKLTLTLLLFFPLFSFSQNCDCMSNFEWVKKTFEENDAGFQFAIDNKGEEAYKQHNKSFLEKIAKLGNSVECTQVIYQWMTFFRSGHIGIRRINQGQSQSENKQSNQEIIDSFKDWEKVEIDLKKFQNQLKEKNENDFEGIWVSEPYKIGIKKVGNEYLGFIIEADGIFWSKGQVKLRVKEDLSSTYYMRDHSAQNFKSAKMLGNNYLEMGFITLERIYPETKPDPQIEMYFKAISAENPYFEKINANTVLLRIPRFWGSEKSKIDSVINSNKETILKTENLIIDLRNNGGGSDGSFQELLPILYTNPIRTVGVQMLSTPLNNQRMLDFINKEEYGFDEEGKKWAQESYDKLSKHIGEFVMLNEYPITKETFDTIHKFPKNIGIIINENNGSTTEQFLLAAKQSKKVKLFGTTTTGVLDISNMYFVKSPCEEFELGYSLSKSMRIPEMTIDDKGIQPDYYIDKEIPKYEWIKFVSEILNE